MNIEQEIRKIRETQKKILELLEKKEAVEEWVRFSTIKKLGLTAEQIRYAKDQNEGVARKFGNRYEYNYFFFKKLAA